ncbi:hypothetical protein AB1Y20_017871 [Prymnesium parvum]|uniref:CDAN1-interacting nuclease 1 n=1 Tax=Prymnesium parvum TaxID=97485 RepID=A0AB34JLV7_PRYPA
MVITVWVQLLRGGENIGRASQITLEDDSNVDDLCKAVKVDFSNQLQTYDAAQLNVSTARESSEYLRPAQKLQVLPPTKDDEPLFVHVPALAGGSEQGAAQDPDTSKRSLSRAEIEQIVEQRVQKMRRSDVQDVSSSHSQSHSEYVNIGKKFVDSPPEEFTWQQMLFPISVPEDIEQTANSLLHSFQQHAESHSGRLLEKDLQEWCKKSLCSKTTSDAQDGMDWSPRSLLDTSSGKQRSSYRNKPDLTMTNEQGLTPYGTIAFIELKSYEENLEPSNTGQVMYAVQEALKRCKLRSQMFAFLTNFKTSLLVKWDDARRVFSADCTDARNR